MSEESAPRTYTDRELTLRAISLTYQRARAAQREIGPGEGRPSAGQLPRSDGDGDGDGDHHGDGDHNGDGDRNGDGDHHGDGDRNGDRDGDGSDDASLDRSPPEADDPGERDLPNPIVTDANLRHYLEDATAHADDLVAAGGALGRAVRHRLPGQADQAAYNAAIVHALHQLDHRTKLQQRTIARLEAELADARRALAALEQRALDDR